MKNLFCSNVYEDMMKLLYLGALLLTFVITSYTYGSIDRLSSGKPIGKRQFPFFVQIYVGQELIGYEIYGTNCGGTLIHPQWVLTAGHCIPNNSTHILYMMKIGGLSVYMDSTVSHNSINKETPMQRRITGVYFHPQYYIKYKDSKKKVIDNIINDVALLNLREPYSIGKVQTISLPQGSSICNKGIIIGGGSIKEGGNYRYILYAEVHSKKLKDLDIKFDPKDVRKTVFYSQVRWSEAYPIDGDFGGPFICYPEASKPVQYGIISVTYKYQNFIIITYESVAKHMSFIKKRVPYIKSYSVIGRIISKNSSKKFYFEKKPQEFSSGHRVKFDSVVLLWIKIFFLLF